MPAPEKFGQTLERFGVSEEVKERIYRGFEDIKDKSPNSQRAAFFGQAVGVLNESLTKEQVRDILEANACCKGGSRERNSKQFAKENKELGIPERLAFIGEHPEWHMGSAEIDTEGNLIVHGVSYWLKGKFECACPNANQKKDGVEIPKEYCYCCGGHFKYHYEIMLGVKLELLEVVSSPHDTEGEKPCVFKYRIMH